MYRILTTCVDVVAAMAFLIPILAIYNGVLFHSMKRTAAYIVFAFYLIAVMSLVGLPSIENMQIDVAINFVPLIGMVSDVKNTLLNVLLFIPMGYFLPVLWGRCRRLYNTLGVCFCVTGLIELLQIFTFRTTDINDIIANVLGGLIGYYVARWLTKNFSTRVCQDSKNYELPLICITSLVVMFLGSPLVSDKLWDLLLR